MLRKIQINILFYEALDQIYVYAKFMNELLSGKGRLKDDENVVLEEKCNAIIQRKLPPKRIDPIRFTIPCSIGPVKVDHTLCDLGCCIREKTTGALKQK